MNTEISSYVDSILDKWSNNGSSLISILLDIQSEYNYLPKDALIRVSKRLNIPLIQVYSVATFYKSFSLKPRGKHLITVCLGTACHVRGAPDVLNEIENQLNINVGETTSDNNFTLETVRCLGTCAIGPVVTIDGKYFGQMNSKKIHSTLKKYDKKIERVLV
jgi:NADH-quinone oxidoreductase subunit E